MAATKWWESLEPLLFQAVAEHCNQNTLLVGYRKMELGGPEASRVGPGEGRASEGSPPDYKQPCPVTPASQKIVIIFSIYHDMKMVRIHLQQMSQDLTYKKISLV